MPELQSPWSEGKITVPDDAVETYREQGWSLVEAEADTEDSKSDKPPAKSTAHRRTKSQ